MGDRALREQEAGLRMLLPGAGAGGGDGGLFEAGRGGIRPGRWKRWEVNEMCNAENLSEFIAPTKNLLCT